MNTKNRIAYLCQNCGAVHSKWSGCCTDCGSWNSLQEETLLKPTDKFTGYANQTSGEVVLLSAVQADNHIRRSTTLLELDRALGGGVVIGSTILIGGDPGIGKSTLLLQALCGLGREQKVLYVTGEESLQQVAMRARRMDLPQDSLRLVAETQIERIIALAAAEKPAIMAIDSIQTMYTELTSSLPGGVGQIKECTAQLVRYAKSSNTTLFIVGHVTKEGTIAGPKILEHMVDSVLYFEGERDSKFRMIRATKNRFGAVNELGVFGMTDKGLKEVTNPSSIFLANRNASVPGSAILVTWEGSRPLLVEIQALVDDSYLANPRRVTSGLDQNRLSILLAVLHRHGGVPTYNKDIFVNIVGGIKINETAVDLALLLAILSSIRNRPLPQELVIFGEVGLAGEIRPVPGGQERLKAALKHGFSRAIIPKGNTPPAGQLAGIEIFAAKNLSEVLQAVA